MKLQASTNSVLRSCPRSEPPAPSTTPWMKPIGRTKAGCASPVSIGFSSFCSGPNGRNHYNLVLTFRPVGNRSKAGQRENLSMAERWLSVHEIAAHLGVNRDTIYKWIERKKMPAHKVGRLWKFLASEIDAWVMKGTAGQKET